MTTNNFHRIIHERDRDPCLWLARWDGTGYHFRIGRHPTWLEMRALLTWECKMVLRRSIGAGELPLPKLGCTNNKQELFVRQPEDARQFLIRDHVRALDAQATAFFLEIERHQHSDGCVVRDLESNAPS